MPRRRRAGLFNFLAVVCLGLALVSMAWTVGVAANPYGWYNPLPPATPLRGQPTPAAVARPTVMPTREVSIATPTVPASPSPEASHTATPDISPAPSPTGALSPTPVPSPTRSVFTFTAVITLQVHPVQVCDWMGLGGTVVDLKGRHVPGVYVHAWGLGGVDQVAATGDIPGYGASGWEVRLARSQIVGNWNVQLVAASDAKVPLSDVYTIAMPGDCTRNLAQVRFEQNH
jgi:hypothetical protein